jgi:hypothetical protein
MDGDSTLHVVLAKCAAVGELLAHEDQQLCAREAERGGTTSGRANLLFGRILGLDGLDEGLEHCDRGGRAYVCMGMQRRDTFVGMSTRSKKRHTFTQMMSPHTPLLTLI